MAQLAKDYDSVMGRSNEIMKEALGLDYAPFESGSVAFDYEALMKATNYTIDEINRIQSRTGVGSTPLLELRNITAFARKYAKPGYGARIFVKDEAANASGSFKDRRAACAVAHAKKLGYKGVGQPEIVEKARKCEALGAEVIQLTVGPELFYTTLSVIEDTGYFNASLYSPYGIAGIETLGYEIAMQCREKIGKDPDMVVCTNAGGGMVTGTARGLIKAGCKDTKVVAASIDLTGLSMASDVDFNRKSCTTGHTGFGVPYATDPDHSDVPRSAARPLRYMDEYVTTTQGEVMYMTEMLANIEGLERGPAGNTALACAFSLAQELPVDAVLVVSETEYTGAGKHIQPQLAFAKENGIDVRFGNPQEEDKPGTNLILPKDPSFIKHKVADLKHFKQSRIKKAVKKAGCEPNEADLVYLAEEVKEDVAFVKETLGL